MLSRFVMYGKYGILYLFSVLSFLLKMLEYVLLVGESHPAR